MKFALIGCGRIATNHIAAATGNKLEISAVCDVVPEHMQSLLAKHGLENDAAIKRYEDYHEMLRDVRPDLVAVATESGKHAQIALASLDAGCHVIIEKPIALSLADADAIIAKSEEKGLVVSACHQNRFNLAVQEMRAALEAGRFGPLSHGSVHVRWARDHHYYEQAPWRGTWAQDGGALMNQSIHGIDLFRWMLGGEIDTVYGHTARRQHPYLEAEDVGMAVVQFQNGAVGTIEGTTNVYPKNLEETLYVFGKTGTVKLGGTSTNHIDVWDFENADNADEGKRGMQEPTSNVYGNGHTRLYANVLEAINTGRAPYVSAKDGRDALELVLAVYLSQKTGQPVPLPLRACSTMDFDGVFGG